jgi:ribosomal protein S18 acetylase RimI-like enzyme
MDVIGVDPDYQHNGIGRKLIDEFVDHIKSLGIHRINMLVRWDDAQLVPFLSKNMFKPTTTINLVREL